MNKYLLHFSALAFLGLTASAGHSQQFRHVNLTSAAKPAPINSEAVVTSRHQTTNFVTDFHKAGQMSPLVTVPGADQLPISGIYFLQSNGRALHNVQVDPNNPSTIHAVIQQTTANTAADTAGSDFPSRRVFYTMSSDAGKHWSAPVALGSSKSGFASMMLINHGGVATPVIAAHRLTAPGSSDIISVLYIKQPDGTFKEFAANRNAAGGTTANILWPSIDVTPDGNTLYMIGDVSATGALDYMQFGTWSLTYNGAAISASFNGWKSQIGASNANYPNAGYSSGGDHVLHVSPSGKIGVFWQNAILHTSDVSDGLYYLESTDGGDNWGALGTGSSDYGPIVPLSDPIDQYNGGQITPNAGMDFWFDGDTPKFIWGSEIQYFDASTNSGRYYPTSGSLMFFNGSDSTSVILSNVLTAAQHQPTFAAQLPAGSQSDLLGHPIMEYPTVALSPKANTFSIFFQAYAEGDSAQVTLSDGSTSYYMYGSIWQVQTTDGGLSWSDAMPVATNTDATTKVDYAYPMTSTYNPVNGQGVVQDHIVYQADSLAGYLQSNGLPSFSVNQYFHQLVAGPSASVKDNGGAVATLALEQNYPNPFNPSTTIDFDLKEASNVTLTVEDMFGRPVATIVSGRLSAGEHSAVFNAANLSSGVYRYTLSANGESVSKTMTLMK